MAYAPRARGVGADGDGADPVVVSSPLRIAWPRLRLWALGLFGIGIAPIVAAPFFGFHDWTAFWTAGHLVGTADIVSTDRTIAWQAARGLALAVFLYPPPAALLLWPFAQLPFDVSYWVHAAAMLASAVGAAILGARVYRLPVAVAVLSAVAWAPVTSAVAIGQNAPFALLLAMVAISGIARGRWLRAGSAVAALLYKPTLGLPLGGVLVLRGWWRAVAVTVAGIEIWYVAGIWVAGGSPGWPADWARTVGDWLADDGVRNADKAVSLPGLLSHVGLPEALKVAHAYLLGHLKDLGIDRDPRQYDFTVQAVNLNQAKDGSETAIGFFISLVSALLERPVEPTTVVVGEMSVQGLLQKVANLSERLELSSDSGARRVLIPSENKRDLADVPDSVLDRLQAAFYSDPLNAAIRAMTLE